MTSASCATADTASASRISPRQKVSREPLSSVCSHCRLTSTPCRLRLSNTVTRSPRDNRRATRFEPMNPDPPITRCFAKTSIPNTQNCRRKSGGFYIGDGFMTTEIGRSSRNSSTLRSGRPPPFRMCGSGDSDHQAYPRAGAGLDSQAAVKEAHSLTDDYWFPTVFADRLFGVRICESGTSSVILDRQNEPLFVTAQRHFHTRGEAMFSNVYQCLLNDARHFVAGFDRQVRSFGPGNKPSFDSCFVAELRDKGGQENEKLVRRQGRRLHSMHQVTEFLALLPEYALNSLQLAAACRILLVLDKQSLDFELQADQGLDDTVVHLAGSAGLLDHSDSGAQPPPKIEIENNRTDLIRESHQIEHFPGR